jgi:cation diffusion facilitator family transporter
MMVIEVAGGLVFGSMALLADGLHMASHAVALTINAVAYVYARRHAADTRFSFGTGKVNALGGFTGAILLAGFAFMMAYESVERILNPVEIQFTNAIIVACVGLVINGASVFILGVHNHEHDHGHGHHDHDHHHGHDGHDHGSSAEEAGLTGAAEGADGDHDHRDDHNLRAAYFHVLADALTSFTAIFALLAGRYFNAVWLDPVMGIVGSLLVARWSIGLLKDTSRVLLDMQAGESLRRRLREAIEGTEAATVTDLHMWSIGPSIYNVNISVVSENPKSPAYYKALLPEDLGIVHSTVEVHPAEE